MAHFEAFLVPIYHVKFPCETLHVAINVRYLNILTPNNQTASQVQWRLISLLNKLVITIKRVGKTLIDIPRQELWIDQVVQG